jgi:tetratricopeptide (TPR) repeat protein
VKSFYGLIALVPVCVFATLGWEFILRRPKPVFLAAATLMGVWTINSYASFWIRSWDPEAHLTLGHFLATTLDNTSGAIQEYAEAFRLAPNDPRVRNRLATQLAGQNPAEMNRLLQLNLKEHPENAETHSIVSFLLGQQKRFDEGIAEARKAISLAPDQPLASAQLWNLLMATDRYREAAEASRAGLRVNPYDAEIQCQAGLAFLRFGDPTNALIHFAHAVSLKPDSPDTRDDYGMAFLALHQEKSALEQSSKAVQLRPDSAPFHHRLALALAANGKTADAIKECRRALELDPNLSSARDTLKSLEPSGKP